MATDPEQERHRLMDVYSRMADGEIQEVAEDEASLTELARQVLHDEMARRGFDHLLPDRGRSQDGAADDTWAPVPAFPGGKVEFIDTTDPKSFEEIVEWAYSTLPQKIRDLPDFPGIQVVDEPPPEKRRRGYELLGLYRGTLRTKRSYAQLKYAPDLIFVFRGPILRCSKGDLRAEVKRVVWHEVAHWLGYETEEQVKALGL